MIYLLAIVFALWMATLFGKPPTNLPPTVQTWRCVLRNKKVFTVEANSEPEAIKKLMQMRVDVSRIETLEAM